MSVTEPTKFVEHVKGWATIGESAEIHGIALIPRISRNNRLYTKEELKRFHNVKVPLNWEHDSNKVIGEVTFYYNAETEQVYYEGTITDDAAALLAKNKTLFTSIEANPVDVKSICNGPSDCFTMPFGLTPTGLALTETPGVPETSVNVMKEAIMECFHDHKLENKYAPNQTNLNNEQHLAELTQKEVGDPGIDDQCIQTKISKIRDDNPGMPHDQMIAIAISQCASKESIKLMLNHDLKEYFCVDCGELKRANLESMKLTQEQTDYREAFDQGMACGMCRWFNPLENSCQLVEGLIQANHVCNRFESINNMEKKTTKI